MQFIDCCQLLWTQWEQELVILYQQYLCSTCSEPCWQIVQCKSYITTWYPPYTYSRLVYHKDQCPTLVPHLYSWANNTHLSIHMSVSVRWWYCPPCSCIWRCRYCELTNCAQHHVNLRKAMENYILTEKDECFILQTKHTTIKTNATPHIDSHCIHSHHNTNIHIPGSHSWWSNDFQAASNTTRPTHHHHVASHHSIRSSWSPPFLPSYTTPCSMCARTANGLCVRIPMWMHTASTRGREHTWVGVCGKNTVISTFCCTTLPCRYMVAFFRAVLHSSSVCSRNKTICIR
jgi:hypothetical protein